MKRVETASIENARLSLSFSVSPSNSHFGLISLERMIFVAKLYFGTVLFKDIIVYNLFSLHRVDFHS